MGIFGWNRKKKDDYDEIYDSDDLDFDPSDPDEDDGEAEERIEELRGTISSGDCYYCGGKNSMKYDEGGFFYCKKCNCMLDEDLYYRWAAGYSID